MSDRGRIDTLEIPPPLRAPKLTGVAICLVVIGIAAFVTLLVNDRERAWSSLLQGMLIPTYLGIASLWFVALHSVCNARWQIPLRRVMEGLSAGLPVTLIAFIALGLFGGTYLYDWVNLSGTPEHRSLFHVDGGTKSLLMTKGRWIAMNGVIILLWMFFRMKLVGLSLRQDRTGEDIRPVHLKWSIAYVIFFALSITFFVWDMLLSLNVQWFSTMWGVYCFTSAVQTFLCVLTLLMVWLRRGPLRNHIQEHTVHDVGTWMVGWSCFCVYIGFSQFMLIYYANMDEETFFYRLRGQNGYGLAYAVEAIIRWPLCFLGLMSQSVRTKSWALVIVAIAVLIGNWMDWSWIIMPAFAMNEYRPFWQWEVLVAAGFAGAVLLLALRFWAKHGLIPKGDPRLLATINAEHLH